MKKAGTSQVLTKQQQQRNAAQDQLAGTEERDTVGNASQPDYDQIEVEDIL